MIKPARAAVRAAMLSTIAMSLTGCGTPRLADAAAEASILKPPAAEIRGKTAHDQRWIDQTVEAGVQGLGWKRPGPRPKDWDRPAKTAQEAIERAAPPAPTPKPRPRWLQMLRPREVS